MRPIPHSDICPTATTGDSPRAAAGKSNEEKENTFHFSRSPLMKRLAAPLIVLFIACCSLGTSLASSTADTNRILFLQNRLVHLPDGQTSYARVSKLLFDLARLQPSFSSRYFRIASMKLQPANYNAELNRLANRTIRIVKNSDITPTGIYRISLQVEVILQQNTVPSPTPYQA
jgi:hypothetical protein